MHIVFWKGSDMNRARNKSANERANNAVLLVSFHLLGSKTLLAVPCGGRLPHRDEAVRDPWAERGRWKVRVPLLGLDA